MITSKGIHQEYVKSRPVCYVYTLSYTVDRDNINSILTLTLTVAYNRDLRPMLDYATMMDVYTKTKIVTLTLPIALPVSAKITCLLMCLRVVCV